MKILSGKSINREEWSRLVQTSPTGTWFQTPEAYDFFASMPELFRPFVVAIANNPSSSEAQHSINPSLQTLRAVCIGYVTVEKNPIKQFFTRRAIVIGGPALADDATDEEVNALLEAVKTKTRHLQSLNSDLHETTHQSACMQAFRQPEDLSHIAVEQQDASQKHAALTKNTKNIFYCYEPIYIETRNFNDYSRWKDAFAKAGFSYQPHLNFHVDCTDEEAMWERLSENRCRQVRKAHATVECLMNEGISELEVREWYEILAELYRTKVKTPLWPVEFFLEAYRQKVGRFMLVRNEGKIIGGSMVVTDGKAVYEWFECGLNAEYKEQYPSVMATWAGMSYAAEHACARYDMMGAGVPAIPYGVRDFKAEFGGELVEHGRFLCVTKPLLYQVGKLGVRILKCLKQF